jgi:cytoskeleton protein RodZ
MTARKKDKDWRQAPVQAESSGIKAVGAWLKAAREANGETLNDISRVTRIGKIYLEALEEGSASKLPSPAYTRGFIRLYAAHLGLSQDEALMILDRNQRSSSEMSAAENDSDQKSGSVTTERPAPPGRNRLLILLILFSCFAAALLLFSPLKQMILPEKPAQSSLQTSAPDGNILKAPAGLPAVKSAPEPSAAKTGDGPVADGIILRLKAVRDGKLHITIDDAVSQEYDLVAGDIVEWKAEKAFLLDIENAASVEGELNGVPLKPFGEQGQPAHMLISSDGAHKE